MKNKLMIALLIPFCLMAGCKTTSRPAASATPSVKVEINEKKMEAAQNRMQTENMYRVPHKH